MDDACNVRLRQEVEEWLRKAMAQIKLVKDEEFCKPVVKNLKQLNDLMIKNKRLHTSTLEECRKLIQTALRKTFSKLVLENYMDDDSSGIFESTILQSFLHSGSTGRTILSDNSAVRTDKLKMESVKRLALKYPRKKIGAPDKYRPCNLSHDIEEQSTSTLFKRRHEVFAPPPQPATYGEHKRMMMQLQEDTRKQNTPKAVSYTRINQENATKQNTPKVKTDILISQQNAKKQDISKTEADFRVTVNNKDKPTNMFEQCTSSDQMSVSGICVKSTSSNNPPEICNINDIVGDKSLIDNRNDARVLMETTNKIAHQQSESECSTKDCETNGGSNEQTIENVKQSKPVKPNHKNKVNHRELHELLSYTAEIFPKLSRRKSVSPQEEHNRQLLIKFGITRTVQIVLQPIEYSLGKGGQIAQRTRSKSIDSAKYLKNLEAAKQTVPAHNKISHHIESRSMEQKKQSTTLAKPNAKKTKPTAFSSFSHPKNNVQPTSSSKNRANIKNVFNNVTNEGEQKVVKPNTVSKKRIRRSPSLHPAKRSRSSTKDAPDFREVQNDVQTLSQYSDRDEPIVLLPNTILNRNPQPNNDPKVHCHSDYMKKCCLCSYKGELMVQHYVYNHPRKAVYVSRLAPEQARLIRADPFGISGRKAVSRYGDQEIIVFRCHFCDLRLSESQELWLDHISKHTGEYRYKCKSCPTFARLSIDRVTHHSVCTNPSMQLCHKYTFDENHLYAYMCNECNFVQVLFINMMRHLRQDHPEAGLIEIGYIKFSLVNFNLQDEETELPYGMVKLEPILDDTNASMQEIVKQKVKITPFEDCLTHSTVSFQDIVQEQRSPEVVFIKEEIFTDDIDQSETNTSEKIAKNKREPQEGRQCSYSSSVRVKRLPGDNLSTKEDNILENAPRNSKPTGDSSCLNEYFHQHEHSTNKVDSKDTANSRNVYSETNQRIAASSMVALQPWNVKSVNKMVLHRSKLTVSFLTAPFKCTAFNCGFHTDTSQTMGSHFQSHKKPTQQHPVTHDSSWLECCYCNYVSLSVHYLLKHIETVHKYSAYQCDRCCYRSRDPNSVRVHQRNYHLEYDTDAKIIWFPSRRKEYCSMDSDIIMNHLKSHVKALKCTNCSSRKFCDLAEYWNHIKSHGMTYIACHVCDQLIAAKEMIAHISSHKIFMIQCIYCDYGINDLKTIKKHIADEHSDKLLCYHIRCSKPNVPPFIRVQSRISPERFVNCETN